MRVRVRVRVSVRVRVRVRVRVLEPALTVGVVVHIVTPAEPAVRGPRGAEDEDVARLRLVCARLVRGKGRG